MHLACPTKLIRRVTMSSPYPKEPFPYTVRARRRDTWTVRRRPAIREQLDTVVQNIDIVNQRAVKIEQTLEPE